MPAALGLARLVLTRVARMVAVLAGVVVLVFAVVRAVPGDPAVSILGDQAPPDQLARLRSEMGLGAPLLQQFATYTGQILDGSLGRPFTRPGADTTVAGLIAEVFPFTLELALLAVLFACLLALPLGTISALRRGRAADHAALAASLAGLAMPVFWLGPLLIHLLCVECRILPDPAAGVRGLPSLVLPAFVLGLALTARLTRMVRSSMLDVLVQPHVTAARARGLSPRRVLLNHVLRNALVPVVTVLGLQFAALLSGALVTEKVFARPGIGTLLIDGIAQRDYAIVQGTTLFIGAVYAGVNLLVDLAYAAIDPRMGRALLRGEESR